MTIPLPEQEPTTTEEEILQRLVFLERKITRLNNHRIMQSPCWTIAGGIVLGFISWIALVLLFWLVLSILGIGFLSVFGR